MNQITFFRAILLYKKNYILKNKTEKKNLLQLHPASLP